MISRLVLGLFKGVVLGAILVAGAVYGLHWSGFAVWLSYVAAVCAGAMAGLFTGKAIWQKGAKIEAGLKAFVGALLGAAAMWAIQKWVPIPAQATAMLKPALEAGQVSVLTLPMVTTVLALIFEIDNTPAAEDAKSGGGSTSTRTRLGAGKVRVADSDDADAAEAEAAVSRRAKR